MNEDKISEEELELGLKISRLRTHIKESNILMKHLIEYPLDVLEHNKYVIDIIKGKDIKEFKRLTNRLSYIVTDLED